MNKLILTGVNSFLGIEETILSLFLLIDAKIYNLISSVYSLYMRLARAEIFTNDLYKDISSKAYAIMGVIALFVIAYSLLQALVNPDNTLKGEKSAPTIIKNLLLALVLIGFIPTIFNFLFAFQNALLSYNTIPKFILGNNETNTTISETIYYQDANGNYIFTEDCTASSYEEALEKCEKLSSKGNSEDINNYFNMYGYELAYTVLNGFLYPNYNNGYANDTVEVNASDYFDTDNTLKIAGTACLIGGGLVTAGIVALEIVTSPATGFATLAAVPGTITAFGGTILSSCAVSAAAGFGVSALGYAITYDNYTWEMATAEILSTGDFDRITPFAEAISGGRMNYIPIISSICGLIVLYMLASFCLDLGFRAAKLVFYEMFAPICLLMSVVPANKDLLGKWIKTVLTTWLEVFTRIICVCGLAYLLSKLNNTVLSELGLLAKAIIVMGLVMFAKQLPKLLGELTGLKSEGMKLGIMEKLKDGGALAAGAIIGGGITSGVRNLTHAGQRIHNKWKEDTDKGANIKEKLKNAGKGAFKGMTSTVAGTVSGGARSFKGAKSASNLNDVREAATKGATGAVKARTRREEFYEAHGNNLIGGLVGHIGDTAGDITRWAAGGAYEYYEQEKNLYDSLNKEAKAMKSTSEDLVKKKLDLFTMSDKTTGIGFELKDSAGNVLKSSSGEEIKFDVDASLSEVDAVISALKASGNIEDARIADKLNTAMQKRIKNVASAVRTTAQNQNYTAFNSDYIATTDLIENKAIAELQEINSNYLTLESKVKNNNTLEGVRKFIGKTGGLTPNNVNDLSDELEAQISLIEAKMRREEALGHGKKNN